MKEFGYGKGYKYAHNEPNNKADQRHFPKELKPQQYYQEKDENES
jgi:putative ATPase